MPGESRFIKLMLKIGMNENQLSEPELPGEPKN